MSFTYKGLEATYTRHRITDEELERQLERLRRQTPQVVPSPAGAPKTATPWSWTTPVSATGSPLPEAPRSTRPWC